MYSVQFGAGYSGCRTQGRPGPEGTFFPTRKDSLKTWKGKEAEEYEHRPAVLSVSVPCGRTPLQVPAPDSGRHPRALGPSAPTHDPQPDGPINLPGFQTGYKCNGRSQLQCYSVAVLQRCRVTPCPTVSRRLDIPPPRLHRGSEGAVSQNHLKCLGHSL